MLQHSLPRRPRMCHLTDLLKRSGWIGAMLLIVFAFCGELRAASEDAASRVVYINSYHRGYSWSDGIEQGLRDGFAASGRNIELSTEYLDSRRFTYGSQIEPLAQSMAVKYAGYRPELVVVSDNAAFDFVVSYRDRLFPGLPIVFCGYNNFRPEVIEGIANVTGVNEEIDIGSAVDMALKVHPETRTLAFVASTGEASSKRIGEVAERSVFPKLRERFELVVMKDQSLDEVRQRLAQLPHDSLLFLSGQVRDQAGGRALTPGENAELLTAASPFPSYTFWDFHLNHGVIGGRIITGPEQGRAAAELALRVLAGESASDIPVVVTTPTSDIFDHKVMERFAVDERDLPSGARIINRPFSLWASYRLQILGVVGLLMVETLLVGLLLLIARDRRRALRQLFRERETLEQRVAERTAALEHANAQLALQSYQDSLTGLANRRRFDLTLEAEYLRLHRSGTPLSLIMLDVDHFKDFNDSYGHVAGDDCLRRVGGLLGTISNRAPDLAARYGGEEFCLILPETDRDGAALLAERIRKAVEELAIPHRSSLVADHVTASLGVATVDASTQSSAQDIVRLADQQLYLAKSRGRNRVAQASQG